MLYPRIHELPFDARRKRMSTIHRDGDGRVAFVKGAPREMVALCSRILLEGEEQPLTPALREEVMAANDGYARQGLRVLAVARRILPEEWGAWSAEDVERALALFERQGVAEARAHAARQARGDVTDPDAARAAGCPTFCVPYGYNEGKPVDSADCDALVSDLLAAYRQALTFKALKHK